MEGAEGDDTHPEMIDGGLGVADGGRWHSLW